MSGSGELGVALVRVTSMKLAMWLKLNGHPLIQREMSPDGQIVYLFCQSSELKELVRYWDEEADAKRLSRFASLVSYEIRRTLKKRRALGLPNATSSPRL